MIEIVDLQHTLSFNTVLNDLKNYDFIFLHCLHKEFIDLINKADNNIIFVWLLWGAEVHGLSEFTRHGYQKKTKKLLKDIGQIRFLSNIYYSFPEIYYKLFKIKNKIEHPDIEKRKALNRINYCGIFIKEEYDLIKGTLKIDLNWLWYCYYNIDDIFTDKISSQGNNLQVGNSADPSNNHLDMFDKLKNVKLFNRKIICPLSYGSNSKKYVEKIVEMGYKYFGDHFYPILDFIPLDKYNEIINSCSIVIMNHNWQQAVGNIIQSIYRGADLYLNESTTTYKYFKRMGIHFFSIEKDLNFNFDSIEIKLTDHQRKKNFENINKIFSKININLEVYNLVEQLIDCNSSKNKQQYL